MADLLEALTDVSWVGHLVAMLDTPSVFWSAVQIVFWLDLMMAVSTALMMDYLTDG